MGTKKKNNNCKACRLLSSNEFKTCISDFEGTQYSIYRRHGRIILNAISVLLLGFNPHMGYYKCAGERSSLGRGLGERSLVLFVCFGLGFWRFGSCGTRPRDVMASQRVKIREFEGPRDVKQVEELEKRCEVGPSGKISLFTDLMGDPICRVRHSPAYVMLVAEVEGEIVGLIRGCIKTVTCGKTKKTSLVAKEPTLSGKAAYILGLRVSPTHRRMGIGLKLVQSVERWFKENGAEYAYMATEKENEACIKLFDGKLNYKKFRTPAILVHPVYAHSRRLNSKVKIQKLGVQEAEALYRAHLGGREFFPQDIDAILKNRLSLGTWVAFPEEEEWPGYGGKEPLPSSWAVLSVWNSSDVFKLQVKGVSRLKYLLAATTRFFDGVFPWLKIPSIPDVFHPFGLHFLYGLHAEGNKALKLMKELYWFVHNTARKKGDGCRLIATEVGSCDPLRACIPYWDCFSCPEDLWCIKKLKDDPESDHGDHDYVVHGDHGDWTQSPPEPTLFVDPRDF